MIKARNMKELITQWTTDVEVIPLPLPRNELKRLELLGTPGYIVEIDDQLYLDYPLAIILKHDRRKYYRVLQAADRGNPAALVLFIAQTVERSLDLYLRAFGHDTGGKLLTLAEASRGTSYSPKYLNLLARTGRIGASKRGRVWVTTREAIETYQAGRLRRR